MHRSTLRPIRTRRLATPTTTATARDRGNLSHLTTKTRKTLVAVSALWLAFASAHAAPTAPTATNATEPAAASNTEVTPVLARGRYLVERVGMCADCHSPRNQKGEYIREAWLKGAPLPFQPTVPMPWSPAAPPIAGLPSLTEAQTISFLQDGKRPDGTMPRPPMPEFRFDAADATAVVAYLKSLK